MSQTGPALPATPAGEPALAPPTWDAQSLRDPHARNDKAERVRAMFDAIAPTYERVNTVASLGQDARWRRRTIGASEIQPHETLLDVCCGTGDMLRGFLALAAPPRVAIGLDFSSNMLASGRYERGAPLLLRGDGTRLPLADESADVVTCAFGVRNFQDLQRGLNEFFRVLRVGGRACILEFAEPRNAIMRLAHRAYTRHVLPLLGRLISGDRVGAYRYLPQSIATFESTAQLCQRLRRAGFAEVKTHAMNLGGVVLYVARKAIFAREKS